MIYVSIILKILDQKDGKKEKPGRTVPLTGTTPATTKGELFVWYLVMEFALNCKSYALKSLWFNSFTGSYQFCRMKINKVIFMNLH